MGFLEPLTDQLLSMWEGLVRTLPLLVLGSVVLILTWIVARVLSNLMHRSLARSSLRPALQELFVTLTKVTIWVLGLLVAVTVVFPSLTPANLLAALGLGSVAIGFAFKDIFENFFAGIMIMLRRPMRMGDYIECENVDGKVETIALRETYIRRTNNELILVPNSYLFMNPLFVHTDRDVRRYDIVVGVAYGEDLNEAHEVIEKCLQGLDAVNYDKPPEVYAREFNDSSMDFTVRWWAGSKPVDMHRSRHQVVTAIKTALDEAGIEIPFPYRTLTFKDRLYVDSESADSESADRDE